MSGMNIQPAQNSANTPSRSAVGRGTGWTSRLLGRFGFATTIGQFLRRHLWAWPALAAVLVAGAGWWVDRSVENAMREQRAIEMNTIVDASVAALRAWMGEQKINVALIAEDETVRRNLHALVELSQNKADDKDIIYAKAQADLRAYLKKRLHMAGYVGYVVASPQLIVIASDADQLIGRPVANEYHKDSFSRALGGQTLVTKPFRSILLLPDEKGQIRSGLPTMFVTGPVRDEAGQVVAALALRIRPEEHFSGLLRVSRFGESGETYVFDSKGLLLSQSRFDAQLKQLGLLADLPETRSILTLELRDPEVNMAAGQRPQRPRSELPLTQMVAAAVQKQDGCDADGHRDYRGVPSVGAWRWLDDYDFGVGTELDVDEAFRPVYIGRRAIRVLLTMLVLGAVGIFLATLLIARQQRALQKAALKVKQLGQYALEQKLGSGGMGTVYRARHAMLRRPTAVKLLDVDKMSAAGIARFEREVQLTSALTHPNTVAIFDYGRTPEGIFYYAMEFLEGLNLDDLVKRFGPLPEARLVHILKQLCGSLAEAHATGLVHRDVKPANIFLTCRGKQYDFVKVLDFGLVKAVAGADQANLTAANAVTGTPLYMSPEAVNEPTQVDARADVYAIGAVGYFLLTGTPVFGGESVVEICLKHVREAPEPPSARRGQPVSPELEALLLRCLAKSPAERPRDAAELLHALETLHVAGHWTRTDAADWWTTHLQAGETTEAELSVPAMSADSTHMVKKESASDLTAAE